MSGMDDKAAMAAWAAGKGFKPKVRRASPEADAQEAVVQFLDIALDRDIIWWSALANGANLTTRERDKLKRAGRRPGSLDLVFIPLVEVQGEDDHAHAGLTHWIEMKSAVGRPSAEQAAVLKALGSLGALCRTLPEVVAQLERWGFPMKARL